MNVYFSSTLNFLTLNNKGIQKYRLVLSNFRPGLKILTTLMYTLNTLYKLYMFVYFRARYKKRIRSNNCSLCMIYLMYIGTYTYIQRTKMYVLFALIKKKPSNNKLLFDE